MLSPNHRWQQVAPSALAGGAANNTKESLESIRLFKTK